MSELAIGIIGMASLFVLLGFRIPVAFSMFVVGFLGIAAMRGFNVAVNYLASEPFTLGASAELVVVPLFILMGNVATETGMSRRLYDAAYAIIGSVRGGLASATIIGCGGFAALSGSSVASALTMGRVSLGEMERFGYDNRLSTGSVAAGGTLGILIPPSTGFVIYAILTQESIGRLFLAGVLPGLLLLAMFVLTIILMCWIWPEMGPAGPRTTLTEKMRAMIGAVPILSVIVVTIGGIYTGIFSPTEASAVGAGLIIAIGLISRTLTLRVFWNAAKSSVTTTATVMLILIAAHMIIPFLALTHIPQQLGAFLSGLDVPPLVVLGLILFCYLILGCFLEGFAMLVLTMPIFFPVIQQLGLDPIWFGVLVVLTLEMGLISPPVGVNVFIVKSLVPHVTLGTIFRGVVPFWIAMMVTLGLLVAFPQIALYLPNTMIN
ncbi:MULTISPECIES: TRAP transporter large permease [Pararhodobacter]|uniref:TRAP transporter large permease protein n=1 Tax=Pararhodobacter aggregans TaxID=404875 RepID=A0A2T7UXE4_9RHOB|nr:MULTISPECIES: TRAP transporter large permease [Pararhodobacter]PTX04995.1 tripartite ATP-independent transporter DctM subunit [Pararhodobacter aggregans]PVE49314.1 C4-dicarboxylate ABC transporter permease [Pararhodobacter aggregans]